MEKIAIIGMGASGVAMVAAYAKENKTLDLTCFDTKESFGRGFPYRDDSSEVILNLKTPKISYNYQDNDDLKHWLTDTGRPVKQYTDRATFGEYLRDRVNRDMEKLGAKAVYEKIKTIDYLEDDAQFLLETESGAQERFDRVHICHGEVGQKDAFQLQGTEGYVHEVFPTHEKLNAFGPDDDVIVIGAGLTAVDVVTVLLKERNVKHVTMASRTGVIPTVRVAPVEVPINHLTLNEIEAAINENNGTLPLAVFEDLFHKELESHGLDYDSFVQKHMKGGLEGLRTNIEEPDDLAIVQALLPPLNVLFNRVWVTMTNADRRTFRQKYHPFMCLNRSPLPQPSAEYLLEQFDAGRLDLVRHTTQILKDGDAFVVETEDNTQAATGNAVVNATGLDTFFTCVDDKNPLLAQLLDKRILQKDAYGGIVVLPKYLQAVSPRYGTLNKLHVHGVLASGVQYRNNSTLIMQMTADTIAKSH